MKLLPLKEIITEAMITRAKEIITRNSTFSQNIMGDTFFEVLT